ncbi:MAG: hypothetical protein AAGC78_18095 [Cellvibrio sp.]|uniref:tetratricopeptide repeat protein n=1 Tax=Cellvibrio sp. TaxID=1965322 RepID=UPI0031AD5282
MKRFLFTPAFLMAFLLGAASASASGWVEYTSPHVQFYSDASESQVAGWIESLENQANLVQALAPSVQITKVKIITHSDYALYQKIKPTQNAGAFVDRIEGSQYLMIGRGVRPISADLKKQTIIDAYLWQYLMQAAIAEKYPVWYTSGLRTILNTADVHDNQATIGVVRSFTTIPSAAIPLESLIFGDKNTISNPFYKLNAGAAVYYFLFGSLDNYPNHQQQIATYLATQTPKTREGFEQVFGQSIVAVQESYQRYLAEPSLKAARLKFNAVQGGIEKRKLSNDELGHMMARVLIHHHEYDYAEKYFKKINKNSPQHADIALSFQKHEQELQMFAAAEKSLKKNPDNAELQAQLANHYWEQTKVAPLNTQHNLMQKSIEHAERSLALAPGNKDMHVVLRFAYNRLGNSEKVFEHIKAYHQLDPDNASINSVVGIRYLREKNYAAARTYLNRACELDKGQCEMVRLRIEEIDKLSATD